MSTPAVVLRLVNYSEADRIVHLYTERAGRVPALARSARRSRRRFGGALDLFVHLRAQLKERPRAELMLLEEVEVIDVFPRLRSDLTRFSRASYMVEMVREMTRDREAHPEIYRLLVSDLSRLNREPPREDILPFFEMTMLKLVGLAPHLEGCLSCQAPPGKGGMLLDAARGGLVCLSCGGRGPRLSPGSVRSLTRALARSPGGEPPFAFTRSVRRECNKALAHFITYHLGRRLRTRDFLERV